MYITINTRSSLKFSDLGRLDTWRKHYNMRSILRGVFWNAHNVLCMSGAARVTVVPYIINESRYAPETAIT